MMVMPISRCSAFTSVTIFFCVVASSPVVGSSAMRSAARGSARGERARASARPTVRADSDRNRPSDRSRPCPECRARAGDATRPIPARAPAAPAGDLPADRKVGPCWRGHPEHATTLPRLSRSVAGMVEMSTPFQKMRPTARSSPSGKRPDMARAAPTCPAASPRCRASPCGAEGEIRHRGHVGAASRWMTTEAPSTTRVSDLPCRLAHRLARRRPPRQSGSGG